MAGLDPTEVVVAGTGAIYRAPVGTDFPASISDAVDEAAWFDLGYASEEGAKFSFARESNKLGAWQSFDPIRTIVTSVPKSIATELLQWNGETLKTALGGGTITEPETGEFEFEPADPGDVDEFALIVEGTDGDKHYRFCYRKSAVEDPVEFDFVRSDAAKLPVKFTVLAADGDAKPYLIQTDDPAFAEFAS